MAANIKTGVLKALYFDLKISELIKFYSRTNPKGGYKKIQEFLDEHDFSHEQYSGYHSKYPLTDYDVFNLIKNMISELPWLEPCINKFEVTNINNSHDLSDVFPTISF